MTENEAKSYLSSLSDYERQTGTFEIRPDSSNINYLVPFEIAATSKPNLIARWNRILHSGKDPATDPACKKITVGLIDDALSKPKGVERFLFWVPDGTLGIEGQPKCKGCGKSKTPIAVVELAISDLKRVLPGTAASLWVCSRENCDAGYWPELKWHQESPVGKVLWGIPSISWNDLPLPPAITSVLAEEANDAKHLVCDGWKIGGYPCWISKRQDLSCSCGQQLELVFQIRSSDSVAANFGDGAILMYFACPNPTCRKSQTIIQRM